MEEVYVDFIVCFFFSSFPCSLGLLIAFVWIPCYCSLNVFFTRFFLIILKGDATDCVENEIDNSGPNDHGEISFRGRHVFMGYLGEEAKTRETIDEEGWLHSGDIGKVDQDGQWVYW